MVLAHCRSSKITDQIGCHGIVLTKIGEKHFTLWKFAKKELGKIQQDTTVVSYLQSNVKFQSDVKYPF